MNRVKLKEMAELYGTQLNFEQALSLLLGQTVKENTLKVLVEMGATEVMRLSFEEMLLLGCTKAQAHKLKAAICFTQSFQEDVFIPDLQIKSPEDAAKLAIQYLKGKQQEHVVCMYLDTKNQVKALETVFIGTLNASIMHPREVLLRGVKMAAASVLIFHNHPSQSLLNIVS